MEHYTLIFKSPCTDYAAMQAYLKNFLAPDRVEILELKKLDPQPELDQVIVAVNDKDDSAYAHLANKKGTIVGESVDGKIPVEISLEDHADIFWVPTELLYPVEKS